MVVLLITDFMLFMLPEYNTETEDLELHRIIDKLTNKVSKADENEDKLSEYSSLNLSIPEINSELDNFEMENGPEIKYKEEALFMSETSLIINEKGINNTGFDLPVSFIYEDETSSNRNFKIDKPYLMVIYDNELKKIVLLLKDNGK